MRWSHCHVHYRPSDLVAKAKEIDPDNPEIYVFMGIDAIDHGDPAGAQRAFETYVSLKPTEPSGYNNLAAAFFNAGEPRRAIDLLNHAITQNPGHVGGSILQQMCSSYFMLGDNDAAIEWCQKTVEHKPTWPTRAYADLAMAYAGKGDDAKSRATAAEMRRSDPDTKLSAFLDRPDSWSSAAYKELYESKLVPAWRRAGLPE